MHKHTNLIHVKIRMFTINALNCLPFLLLIFVIHYKISAITRPTKSKTRKKEELQVQNEETRKKRGRLSASGEYWWRIGRKGGGQMEGIH